MSPVVRLRVGLRAVRAPALLAVLLAVSLGLASFSLATLSDADTTTATFSTDTLAPPTGLSVTGGATAVLNWTATAATYASGYNVYRATALAGPYSQVAAVAPRTTVTYTDSPPAGTWWYTVRAYYQSWESVDAVPVSTVVGPIGTGFRTCAANAAGPGGDGNGYEIAAGNACADDSVFASDVNSGSGTGTSCTATGKDKHDFSQFSLGVPGAVTSIDGIEVKVDEKIDLLPVGSTNRVCIRLSWNNGATWTTAKQVDLTATTETTYAFGASNDLWGRAWAAGDFSSANFKVRVSDVSNNNARDFFLDYLAVQVTYTP